MRENIDPNPFGHCRSQRTNILTVSPNDERTCKTFQDPTMSLKIFLSLVSTLKEYTCGVVGNYDSKIGYLCRVTTPGLRVHTYVRCQL